MNIALAQIKPTKGNIQRNIEHHKQWLTMAIAEGAECIVFPELSLTAYEPTLAHTLATTQEDTRLDEFQHISNLNNIVIAIGLPTRSTTGICISMVIFQPHQPRQTYSKQKLHADEMPYFTQGNEQCIVRVQNTTIAPAICYESLQNDHIQRAIECGANLYMASVAKPQSGLQKAFEYYPRMARLYSIPIVMCNSIGYCDTFHSAGQSVLWNANGDIVAQLDSHSEGLLLYNTTTDTAMQWQPPAGMR